MRIMKSDTDLLWELFPDISRTFAFTIPKLPNRLALDLAVCYAICRIIDTLEDTPMSEERKQKVSKLFLKMLSSNRTSGPLISECKDILKTIPTEMKYKRLLLFVPVLNRIYQMLPLHVKEIILRLARKMAKGLLNSKIQHIGTLKEQDMYCHYAAGIVGHIITELFQKYGYIKNDKYKQMLELGWVFGLGLQKVNIIKDASIDMSEGRFYIPKNILLKYNLDYHTIRKNENRHSVIHDLLSDTESYFDMGVRYTDNLPSTPKGLRVFCADNLIMAVATAREIKFRDVFKENVKITRGEVYAIDAKVNAIVNSRGSISELARMAAVSQIF